jgi:hypothetical protein
MAGLLRRVQIEFDSFQFAIPSRVANALIMARVEEDYLADVVKLVQSDTVSPESVGVPGVRALPVRVGERTMGQVRLCATGDICTGSLDAFREHRIPVSQQWSR